MNKASLTVFLCSTYSDLSAERTGVLEGVRKLQLQYGSMEFFGARAAQPIETCLEEVRLSDILVVIIGYKYGSLVPDKTISFTEAEYSEGYSLGKPCLIYLRDESVPILPAHIEHDPQKLQSLERFRALLKARHTVATFKGTDDLAVSVTADLSRTVRAIEEAAREKEIHEISASVTGSQRSGASARQGRGFNKTLNPMKVLIVIILIGLMGTIIAISIANSGKWWPNQVTSTRGDLSGEINEVIVIPDESGGAQVFIHLTIRNKGAPTSVGQYTIRFDHSDSKHIDFYGPPAEISKRYTLPQAGEREAVVVQPQDSIVGRTEQVIAKDQKVSGWMRVMIPAPVPPDILRQPGMWYTVSFDDAAGTSYEASYQLK